MKNLIITLVLLVTFNISFSQENGQDQITNTERIIDKYSDKIVSGFEKVISGVTPIAEDAFRMLVKLKIAEGVAGLLPLILFLIFFGLFNKEYNLIKNNENRKDPRYGPLDEDNCTPQLVCYGLVTIAFFIMSLLLTYESILKIVVPEWFAVKEILNLIN